METEKAIGGLEVEYFDLAGLIVAMWSNPQYELIIGGHTFRSCSPRTLVSMVSSVANALDALKLKVVDAWGIPYHLVDGDDMVRYVQNRFIGVNRVRI